MLLKKSYLPIALLCTFFASTQICRADPILGDASAFNLVALGSSTLSGTISENSDIGGRVAAAGDVLSAPEVGQSLVHDSYGSLAGGYLLVAGGIGPGEHTNVQANGNVYAPGATGSNFNFNYGGSLVTAGASPIDFSSLRTQLDSESLTLAAMLPTGQILTHGQPGFPSGANPSWLVLSGTSAFVNVFNITPAQLASVNNPLDIVVPAGSTVIINVSGTSDSLGSAIYINGTQPSETSNAGADILFNFADATSVTLNGQLTASMLAPLAAVSGNSSIDGTIIAAQISDNGEVHNAEFTGSLPPTVPEPRSLAFVGTGMFLVAALMARRGKGLSAHLG